MTKGFIVLIVIHDILTTKSIETAGHFKVYSERTR